MKRIAIDTNVYAAFKRGDPDVVKLLRGAEFIAVSSIVMGELLAGFRCGKRTEKNRQELEQFLTSPRVHLAGVDEETAEFYAVIFEQLRRKGQPIPTNDLWIAASAVQLGLGLATMDAHFRCIDGLVLVLSGGRYGNHDVARGR